MAFIRFLMILIGLALIGSAVGAVAFAPKLEPYARHELENQLGGLLGTQVAIGKVRPAWLEGALALEDVTIMNPPNFKEGTAAQCDRVLIQPEIFTMFSKSPTIACVTLEGTDLKLRYKPGDGSNLGYFKKQASNAAQALPTPGEGVIVKEVRAPHTKVDLVAFPAISINVKPMELGAIGLESPMAGGAAKTLASLMEAAMKESTSLNGMVQPLVDLLKDEMAPAVPTAAVAAAPAPAPSAAPATTAEAAAAVPVKGPTLDIPEL